MTDSISRRAPALPQLRPASTPETALRPIIGGRASARRQRRIKAAARRHSPQELGLMALCAGAVTLVTGMIVFTTMRDQVYLNRTEPLIAPLKP